VFDTHIHAHQLPAGHRMARECLVPAVNEDEWSALVSFQQHHVHSWVALGVHPQYADRWTPQHAMTLERQLRKPGVVAVGEIGLDKRLNIPMRVQEQVLRSQLRLAVDLGKPVILHNVHCIGHLLSILKEERVATVGGIMHGFYGSVEMAQELVALNLGLGMGRLLLNTKSSRLPGVVQSVPAQSLVVETDAPWGVAVADWRRPLLDIITAVADCRGWSVLDTVRITRNNARRILRMNGEGSQG